MRDPHHSDNDLTIKRDVTIVEVKYPQTELTNFGKKYTTYEIRLKTTSKAFAFPQSSTRRRYSDFLWLRKWLHDHNEGFSSTKKIPSLPSKKILGRFEEDFLVDRMRGLQRFLRRIIEQNVYLSDKALHLFLQSKMSIKDIDDYLNGKTVPTSDCCCSTDGILLYHGDHNCQPEPSEYTSSVPIEERNILDVHSTSSAASSFCSLSSNTLQEVPENNSLARSSSTDSEPIILSGSPPILDTTIPSCRVNIT